MPYSDIDITELLPQRRPFILIDRLLDFDTERVQTCLEIREDNLFCDGGFLTESGLVENIAQTCAARMGYINRYLCHETVKLGLVGAIRNMEIFRLPRIGEQIVTEVTIREEVFQTTLVDASITVGEEQIARSEMKISITNIARKI
ncbi:MAG: pseudouridylate synthase [Tannerellaceae bacterium]|jgi:predicted hotdog family 3-hydroxylacyl-ACP dehydratase|nr:pseudouridylate synthase [Tannerellaceae bacterium]